MEAGLLGLFMLSACGFAVLLGHPASPVRRSIESEPLRRALMGLAMGSTAVALIYSPWGKQSGAHFNPSVTFTFWRLGKVAGWDAAFYALFQFAGGLAGTLLAAAALGGAAADPAVRYAATVPGPAGPGVAFTVETVISFLLMGVVLAVSNTPRLARFTGLCAGALVATYIALASPLSGMSMNPARSFASAVPAQVWTAFWIYFTAPPLGHLLAAQVHLLRRGPGGVHCAKLHHQNDRRCIFCAWRETLNVPEHPSA
jgi:aquaporin Z